MSGLWQLLVEPFQAGYLRRALAEVVLLGLLGGVVGVHVVLRRLAFLTEVVQHAVFPGIAIAYALGRSLLLGALVTGGVAVALVAAASRRRRIDPDALMALLVSSFLALGVVVVSRRPGYQSDLTALLFGRILAVDRRELLDTLVVATVAVVVLAVLHKELVLRAFDPNGAAALGYPVARLDLVLHLVVLLTVVAAVRAVGTVLVVAFLVTPAAAARLLTAGIAAMMAVAAFIGAGSGALGLLISYHGSVDHGWRLASGATVVVVLTLAFAAAAGLRAARSAVVARRRTPAALAAAP